MRNQNHQRTYQKIQNEESKPIGIWGQRHARYLKQNRKVLYMNLLTSGKRNAYHAIGSKTFQSTGDNGACHKQNSMDLSFGKKNNYK